MKTPIIITAYCGEPASEYKKDILKQLCKKLKSSGFHICLCTHSILDEETQRLCNYYMYDSDNSFKINGKPNTNYFAVAELKLVYNAIDYLKRLNYTKFIKMTYDLTTDADYVTLIKQCESKNKKFVTATWEPWRNLGKNLGTALFYSDIDFFEKVMGTQEIYRFDSVPNISLEDILFESIVEKELMNDIHIEESYDNYFGQKIFGHVKFGGTVIVP